MNAVEIEEAVSELAGAQFDAREFPFAFLEAFGNRPVTVQRLRAGSGNASDVASGVLQRNNIHMAVCAEGRVSETLAALRASPKTAANKVKFILATDGLTLEAEELVTGEPLACAFPEFADHFAFFLPLAGISTIKQIKDNPVDIKATGRLNKLYIELLKDNPDWATAERRHDLNHFMARLIFCLFAEDTGIFLGSSLFSATVERMSDSQSINTHEVISELFRAMNTKIAERATSNFRPWADAMPYVNGGLFSGSPDCPRFSKIARSYLLRAAALNWQEINPDIFGSMIQAVADDDERGALGMHYTSVPNILKVLNPLFLDDLRQQLDAAGDNGRALLNLRKRMAKIRVFDPACGSGNFLVIAYKEMRAIAVALLRLRLSQPLQVVLLADRALNTVPSDVERANLLPMELDLSRPITAPRRAVTPADLQWIKDHISSADTLMTVPEFNRAFRTLDQAVAISNPGAGIVIAWAAIEALFRPGSQRITDRISRALATHLHPPGSARDRAFAVIVKSYEARGGAAHAGRSPEAKEFQTALQLARAAFIATIEAGQLPDTDALLSRWQGKS